MLTRIRQLEEIKGVDHCTKLVLPREVARDSKPAPEAKPAPEPKPAPEAKPAAFG